MTKINSFSDSALISVSEFIQFCKNLKFDRMIQEYPDRETIYKLISEVKVINGVLYLRDNNGLDVFYLNDKHDVEIKKMSRHYQIRFKDKKVTALLVLP